MRKSWVQLYAPFLVLAVIQAMFIAVAPSRGPQGQNLQATGPQAGYPSDTTPGVTDTTVAGDPGAGGVAADPGVAAPGAPAGTPGAAGRTGGAAAGGRAAGPTAGPGGVAASGGGDTSHCKNGLQIDLLINNNPPCTPKFTGDNGGETFTGVTKDSIKVVIFSSEPNPQVDAILAQKGLAVSDEELMEFYKVAFDFINKHYELYGRKIVWERVVGDCPTTPPDYDACNAAAQEVVKKKPALIIWNTSLYASVFDIWAKAGIPSLGGSAFDVNFYTQRRPFRYDVGMDGTQAADHIAEYYCKKMAGKKANRSGRVIHPTIGQRDQVDRKLGIVVPEIEANVLTAKHVAAKVKGCGGGDAAIFTYESNIETATQQTASTVAGLIDAKVTTVTCMCDPIAPVFLTQGMSKAGYYPEFLLPGLGLLDYDILGQLYDPQQMEHAFGPSHLSHPVPLAQSDPARVWRAMGKQGTPCGKNGCGLAWAFANMAGIMIQAAGPNYNPANLEKGVLSLPPQGGWAAKPNPSVTLYKFGQGDYTGLSDVREVYWDPNATSPVDGSQGAYVHVNGGRRYERGQWSEGNLEGVRVSPQ